MIYSSTEADFGLKIDFARNTENPARVFRALYGLIDFCQLTDKTLIKCLDLETEPTLLLKNIEEGSITVWLKTVFNDLQDNNLEQRLTNYLVRAKLDIVKFFQERQTIKNISEIQELQNRLIQLAPETDTNKPRIYTPPSDKDLLTSIDQFESSVSDLQKADKLYYLMKSSQYLVNTNFHLSQEVRKKFLVRKNREYEIMMILEVKRIN